MLHVEEQSDITSVLLIGDEFPFVKELVKTRLEKRGCHIADTRHNQFADYIVFFGFPKRLPTHLKRLTDHGKAVVLDADPEQLDKVPKDIATYHISMNKTQTSEAISANILRKLFAAKPYHNPAYEQVMKRQKQQQTKKTDIDVKPAKFKRFPIFPIINSLIILCIIALLPLAATIGATLYAGYLLREVKNTDEVSTKREVSVRRAVQLTNFSQKTAQILAPMIQIISPDATIMLRETTAIAANTAAAALTAVDLEKVLTKEGKNILQDEPVLLEDRLKMVKEQLGDMDLSLQSAELSYKNLSVYRNQFPINHVWGELENIPTIRKQVSQAKEAINILPQLLAFGGEKKYLLLLQNNFELRPTGGFIGSYGLITVKNGKLKDLKIQDVYEADGQLKGRVESPAPIATYLNQPNWFLRDSNWNPDFLFSASQAEWFLQKEVETTVDGVIAVDLHFIKNVLSALDGVYVPDYEATVDADNFFLKLQADTHDEFFAGSSKKKDLLNALTNALLIELTERKNISYASLLTAINQSLDEKHILLYLHHAESQTIIERLGWAGRILNPQSTDAQSIPDYLMVVDANVGVNKVNYYIKREITNTITLEKQNIQREATITYQNTSPKTDGLFNGVYNNYVRILIPSQAIVESLAVNSEAVNQTTAQLPAAGSDKKTLGLFVTVPPGESTSLHLRYTIPITQKDTMRYQLLIQKQPGTDRDPLVIKLRDSDEWRMVNSNVILFPALGTLTTDKLFAIDFKRQVK